MQNELKELLYVAVQSIKVRPSNIVETKAIKYIVTDVEDDQTGYVQNSELEEMVSSEDVKLEIEILDEEENIDDETYNYEMVDSNVECLEGYEIIEEQENLEEEYYESHLTEEEVPEEVHLKENDFDYADCITMTCDLCNTNFKR